MTRFALSAKASQGHFYRHVILPILEMNLFLAEIAIALPL